MIESRELYEMHRNEMVGYKLELLPEWDRLTWPERDAWQHTADEVNTKDRRTPNPRREPPYA